MHWWRCLSQRRSPHSASTLQARPTKSSGVPASVEGVLLGKPQSAAAKGRRVRIQKGRARGDDNGASRTGRPWEGEASSKGVCAGSTHLPYTAAKMADREVDTVGRR